MAKKQTVLSKIVVRLVAVLIMLLILFGLLKLLRII